MASRHSAFYSPLIATLARGFPASYSVLQPGQRSQDLIRDGVVEVMQSAVSSNWGPMDRGESPLPVHFALINRRDGFFLAGREFDKPFAWKDLEGASLLADHGGQPLAMVRYAAHVNDVDWNKISVLDRGTPEEMIKAFSRGEGDFIHLQAPGPQILEEEDIGWTRVSVGASMPEVAFSTLCCSREFVQKPAFSEFLDAYRQSREWVRTAEPREVASVEHSYFPGVSEDALAEAVSRYQRLGTWSGAHVITDDLYEQALNVFEFASGLRVRHPRSAVCL
jgi:ABC-type nitrate/sulfonate/bicarbonate transport system substrate-binding protein